MKPTLPQPIARPYAEVLGSIKSKRRGLTTGTCAQAAALAAALACLFRGNEHEVAVRLPASSKPYSEALISIPLAFLRRENNGFRAGVRKDSGDDDDSTDGILIEAYVELMDADNSTPVLLEGGRGVGRVTRAGLPVKPGQAAINPTPRALILRDLSALLPQKKMFSVLIEVPDGHTIAAKTWNPRLGIVGGISIIGTSGAVEPKSSQAFMRSIVMSARAVGVASADDNTAWLTPGYLGERYLKGQGIQEEKILLVGDHIGLGLKALAHHGAKKIILAGHIGKLIKISSGIFNTHSKWGDARLETLAALAAAEGATAIMAKKILAMDTAEEATQLLVQHGFSRVFAVAAQRAAMRASLLCGTFVEVIMLDLEAQVLGRGNSE